MLVTNKVHSSLVTNLTLQVLNSGKRSKRKRAHSPSDEASRWELPCRQCGNWVFMCHLSNGVFLDTNTTHLRNESKPLNSYMFMLHKMTYKLVLTKITYKYVMTQYNAHWSLDWDKLKAEPLGELSEGFK